MGLSRLRPKALVRYLDVICEEIITVVHERRRDVEGYFFLFILRIAFKKGWSPMELRCALMSDFCRARGSLTVSVLTLERRGALELTRRKTVFPFACNCKET